MNLQRRVSFGLFLVIAMLMIATGVTYLTAPTLMPYHLDAMQSTWNGLSTGIQTMSINFMKSVSAGFLSSGLAVLVLLFLPFRRGEQWAAYAILALIYTQVGIISSRTYDVAVNTAANPPLLPLVLVLVAATVGFVLAIMSRKS
ncbi:hypothetical protein NM22_01775 [Vibrio tubiashii]|nr:hypothetical protein NM22_01775 [Vibrio tubiashii]